MSWSNRFAVNSAGELIVVRGDGDETIAGHVPSGFYPTDASGRLLLKLPATRTGPVNDMIAGFGDSITNNNSILANGTENYGAMTWALQLSRGRFRYRLTDNFGVPGDTSAQGLARIADVLASDAGTVVVGFGTNDRGLAAMTADQTIANLTSIRDQLLAAGKVVVLKTPAPRGDSTYTSNRLTGAQLAYHLRVREWVLSNRGIPNVYPVDTWVYLANPISATGDIKLGYTHDGLHYLPLGAYYDGLAQAEQALNRIVPEPSLLATSNADQWSTDNPYGNVLLNPMFDGTGGTLGTGGSGDLSASWGGTNSGANTACTRAYSKVTDAAGRVWQQCVLGGGPTTSEGAVDLMRQISLHTKVVAGTTVEGLIEYAVDAGSTNVMSVQLGIVFTNAEGTITLWDADRYSVANSIIPNIAFGGILRTPRVVVPAGCTDVRYRLAAYCNGSVSPTMTVRARAASLRRVE
jgi:hypothetical protein